jgi:hypothetical protein
MVMKAKLFVILGSMVFVLLSGGCFEKYLNNYTELPELTTNEVTSITHNSAISGGKIISKGASPILEKGICWDTLPSPTIDDESTFNNDDSDDFSSELTFLNDNTKYFVRAYASNIAGTAYGNEVTFTTKKATVGSIEVFVRQESFLGPFIGGALVNMYLTESDRANDNVYATKITSIDSPSEIGALFEELVDQRYYFKATYTNAQGEWIGIGDLICMPGFKVELEIVCNQ